LRFAVAADRRRARVRAGRLRAGGDPQPDARPPAGHALLVPLHHARPGDSRVPLRPSRSDVPRGDRRARRDGRALLAPAAPVHAGSPLGRGRRRRGGAADAPPDRAGRRYPEPVGAALRLPLPDALPARAGFGAALARGAAALARVRARALRRLSPRPRRAGSAGADRRPSGARVVPSFTTRPELRGTFGMVASTHWLASAAGMAVLERGGNAFDA